MWGQGLGSGCALSSSRTRLGSGLGKSVSLSKYLWTSHTGTKWSTHPGSCCLCSDTDAHCFICLSSFWIWNQLIWLNSCDCASLARGVKWNLRIKTKESQERAGQGGHFITPLSGNKFFYFFFFFCSTQTETVKTGRKTATVALVCHLRLSTFEFMFFNVYSHRRVPAVNTCQAVLSALS